MFLKSCSVAAWWNRAIPQPILLITLFNHPDGCELLRAPSISLDCAVEKSIQETQYFFNLLPAHGCGSGDLGVDRGLSTMDDGPLTMDFGAMTQYTMHGTPTAQRLNLLTL
jgi:hypothetical protein